MIKRYSIIILVWCLKINSRRLMGVLSTDKMQRTFSEEGSDFLKFFSKGTLIKIGW